MYRKQMKYQRVLMVLALVAAVVAFVYALGFMTDLYGNLYKTIWDPDDLDFTDVEGTRIFYDMQPFNKLLVSVSIGLILAALLLFVTQSHCRRRYYIGNYVSAGVFLACSAGSSIWALTSILDWRRLYLLIDQEELRDYLKMWKVEYTPSMFWFDAAYVVYGLLVLTALLIVLNCFWKMKLMHDEKKLLSGEGA